MSNSDGFASRFYAAASDRERVLDLQNPGIQNKVSIEVKHSGYHIQRHLYIILWFSCRVNPHFV